MASNLALWRFDDSIATVRPRDVVGNVGDLSTAGSLTMPTIVDAAIGRGRRFTASLTSGLFGADVVSGSTIAQRDMSIQAIVQWNIAAQNSAGFAGTIYAHGASASAAQRVSGALELRVVNAALGIGEVAWHWQTAADVAVARIDPSRV